MLQLNVFMGPRGILVDMTDPDEAEHSAAFTEGRLARRVNVPFLENPYLVDESSAKQWSDGWLYESRLLREQEQK